MSFTITHDENHWDKLAVAIKQRSEALAEDSAKQVLEISQAIVPVDTGALKRSGHIEPGENGVASRAVVYGTNHCVAVEYGTDRMAAQPYLTPAMEYVRKNFIRGLHAVLAEKAW